jgi:hypothetical protein
LEAFLVGILKKALECFAVCVAPGPLVNIFTDDGPTLPSAKVRSWRSWFSVSWPLSLVETLA